MLLPNIVATAALLSTLVAGVPLLDERSSNAMIERRTPPGEPVKNVVKWVKKKIQPPGGVRIAPISFPGVKGPKRRSADPEPEPTKNPIKWIKEAVGPKVYTANGGGKTKPFPYPITFVPKRPGRRSAQPEPDQAFDGPAKKPQRRSANPQPEPGKNPIKWIKEKIQPPGGGKIKPYPRIFTRSAQLEPGKAFDGPVEKPQRRSADPQPEPAKNPLKWIKEKIQPPGGGKINPFPKSQRRSADPTSTETLHQRRNIKKDGASKAPMDI
ncbi:hypothetical protein HYFRA_00001774 [Hymenoscyphus fraxineus]|uniref:Uncharacterized protein n=1 Tax=Hymenoscyphus fraxineus TaxID=746836 RepID=A0A9N9KK30_9HELO|nr:hypothetical protein HYFRA_00001774 [Hymenoscyphus fraxineus]